VILSPDKSHRGLLRIVGDKIKNIPVDVVFPVIHGKGGEDGSIQGLLEIAGIPYVGCGILSSAVGMDKVYTKKIVDELDIAQAKYVVVNSHKLSEHINADMDKIETELGYPCFVKPSRAGSSVGVTKADNREMLEKALLLASEHDRLILVEETIIGREIECGVLGNDDAKASVVGEIKSAGTFYDFDAKYNNKESKTLVPAPIDEKLSEKIRENAVKIFKALDCKGISRVDFFVEKDTDRIVFNEINTMPGFTSISMYPMMWKESGIDGSELVDKLIEFAFDAQKDRQ
jgi:D-alanine-D-alanine ligase